MSDALLVSNALLWLVVIALAFVVMALVRQIGILHERIAPVGALATTRGPEVGEAAPVLELVALSGAPLRVGGSSPGRRTLLFFLSSTCPVCESLLPVLHRVARDESPRLRVVFASDGEREEYLRFAEAKGIDPAGLVLSLELGLRFEVEKLPYAVLLDENGVVRSKGIVNTREHLESLFEAHDRGVASIQEFLARDPERVGSGGVR